MKKPLKSREKGSKKSKPSPPSPKETIIKLTKFLARHVDRAAKAKLLHSKLEKKIITGLGRLLSEVDGIIPCIKCNCYDGNNNFVGYICRANCYLLKGGYCN